MLVAVGDNCIDYYVNQKKGYVGGNSVNVSVYFKRLGGEASYVGVVGNDENGKLTLDRMKEKGVNISHVTVEKGKTAVSEVELISGERVFGDYEEGVMEFFKLNQEQKDFIKTHKIIITGLWGHVHNDLAEFKNSGMMVAFDGATRPFSEESRVAMKVCDYFFFSADEYNSVENVKKDMKKIFEMGSSCVIATLGEKGSLLYQGTEYISCGIIESEVIDTMGAGDSYIAGFLKGVMDNLSLKECMELGARNASETIKYAGAW